MNNYFLEIMSSNYPEVDQISAQLLSNIQKVLGDKLVGLYLYGSAVGGDFDSGISDIDLLAAIQTDITQEELEKLNKMHLGISKAQPEWDDRIEVKYFSLEGLKNFKNKSTKMANICPGEPLHFIEAGREWLQNWYFVQNYSLILFGPNPREIIPQISKEEFIEKVKEDAKIRQQNVRNSINSKPYQGFYIMTMCRALYTTKFGEQVSKRKASDWVKQKYPIWSALVDSAFEWRKNFRDNQYNPEETYPQTEEFVNFIASEIAKNDATK